MRRHFLMMANYNRWANERLYAMAAALDAARYREDVGVFFASVHGTLNHLLASDRIWMRRLEGVGAEPRALNAIQEQDFTALRAARAGEDGRIVRFVEALDEDAFDAVRDYRTLNGTPQRHRLEEIRAHLFNHQTHHRGQAHAALTRLGMAEPAPLDLMVMLRELASP